MYHGWVILKYGYKTIRVNPNLTHLIKWVKSLTLIINLLISYWIFGSCQKMARLNSPPKSFLLSFVLETLLVSVSYISQFFFFLCLGRGERRRRKEKGRVGFVLHLSVKEECPIKVVMDKLTTSSSPCSFPVLCSFGWVGNSNSGHRKKRQCTQPQAALPFTCLDLKRTTKIKVKRSPQANKHRHIICMQVLLYLYCWCGQLQ